MRTDPPLPGSPSGEPAGDPSDVARRDIVVLGSTGSIGTQALDLVRAHPDRFRVVGLTAGGSQRALFEQQVAEFAPAYSGLGEDASTEAAGRPCDVVLNGITGAVGLRPTLAALDAGTTLALANKESLIMGGPLVLERARPGQIVPVDSEHSAIAQCLRGGSAAEVRRLVLTASGGPFRGRTRAELAGVTPEQAMNHPTWDMGPVITINSATLVNKGLEVIEAHLLFGIPFDRIEVVVHPTSVVHSMVEFVDGSTLVQASPPTMLIPIALGLGWPDRVPDAAPPVDWTQARDLGVLPARRRGVPGRVAGPVGGGAGRHGPGRLQRRQRGLRRGLPHGAPGLHRHRCPSRRRACAPRRTIWGGAHRRRHPRRRRLGARRDHHPDREPRLTAVYYALGVILFFVAILASIGLHELGHMIPAKKFGGKVTQYFIGFGPTVWSKQVGETEVGVKAIPLGGYVKIIGMLPPAAEDLVDEVTYDEDGNRVQKIRKSNTGMFTQLISDARAAEWELIKPEDSDRLFYRFAWWKKVIVMAGGPTVNILIAFFIFWGIFATYGQKSIEAEAGAPVVSTVSACVLPYAESDRECTASDPIAPAAEAGLLPGDRITSFNGTTVTGWEQLRTMIRDNEGGSAVIGYERDGATLTGRTSTTVEARPTSTTDTSLRQVGFLGVSPTSRVVTTNGGPIYTLQQMGTMTVDTAKALVTLPAKVFAVGKAIVGLEDRAQDSPVSIVGGGRLAGETVSHKEFPVAEKAVYLLSLIAGFNFFIGMFNFVPLLPLDGGHIASALWEAIRRGAAELRSRPDPGYVDAAKLMPRGLRRRLALPGHGRGPDRRRPRRAAPPAGLAEPGAFRPGAPPFSTGRGRLGANSRRLGGPWSVAVA